MVTDPAIIAAVRDYYGKKLASSADLQTNACCSSSSLPRSHKAILARLHDEILTRFYGCGSPIPDALHGCTILDLGCGTGRDVFLAASLAGPQGCVIGVDMTDEQLQVARRHRDSQCRDLGLAPENVLFHKGYIEDLAALGIADNSVDVVISNCVINLSSNKARVFAEIHRVLRPGGELYFSDVFSDRRIPDAIRQDPIFHGECLGGALYEEDFRRLMAAVGFPDYRVTDSYPITLENPQMAARAGRIGFRSMTVRAFKIDHLEDRCEDFGQVATYLGTIEEAPHAWALDDRHLFETGRNQPVCGNTAAMLTESRFAAHFQVSGDRSRHFGLFSTPPAAPAATPPPPAPAAKGGCC